MAEECLFSTKECHACMGVASSGLILWKNDFLIEADHCVVILYLPCYSIIFLLCMIMCNSQGYQNLSNHSFPFKNYDKK